MVNPCVIANILANSYNEAIKTINRKFAALQRLAQLLEQIGDISGFIPNIGALIPLYLIDLSSYATLVAACPFLNLPKSPSTEDIGKLQSELAAAYARLVGQLTQHPWLRMGRLQDQMAKIQGKVNEVLDQGAQYLACLQAACGTVEAAANFVNEISQTDFKENFDTYTRQYIGANKQVLNDAMQQKYDQVQGGIVQINELMSAQPVVPAATATSPTIPDIGRAPQIPQLPPNPPPV